MADTQNKPKFESIAATKSPMMVTAALKGVKSPATQKQLLETARGNNAAAGVIANIEKLLEGDYQQMIDVTHNLGHVL